MKTDDALFSIFFKDKDKSSLTDIESEDLGDIVDSEVKFYLNSERETHYKKIIWEQINKEYLQEQAAKKGGHEIAREAAVVQKSKKRQRPKEAAKNNPAQADTEGTSEMLTKKRLSSKINFDVLDTLFSDSPASGSDKQLRASSCKENGSTRQSHCRSQLGEDLEDNYPDVVLEEDDNREQEDPTETYDDEDLDFENEEEYDYNYDDYEGDDGY